MEVMKMKRKIIAILICLCMVSSSMAVFGATTEVVEYLPGPVEYYHEFSSTTMMDNASYNGETLTINGGGKVRFDFLMPFDSAELHVTYEAREDATLSVSTTDMDYSFMLPKDQTTATFEFKQQSGAMFAEFKVDKTVKFSEIWYKKGKQNAVIGVNDNAGLGWYAEVEYTPYQEALQSTIAVLEGSAAIKTKNLTRYINFDDTTLTGRYINGSYYLPIDALTIALDTYYEDYPEKEYYYISGNHFCVWQENGKGFIEQGGKRTEMENFFIRQDGYTWAPVRKVAELAEYTVLYKDGMIIIDNYVSADALINNVDVFEELKLELSIYAPEASNGRVYHVAKTPNASDSNPGTEAAPFETIQRAVDIAKAGDTVIVHDGIYRERVDAKRSGTPSQPIKIMAAEGEEPYISAFEEISNFAPQKHPNNGMDLYIASLGGLEFQSLIPGHWDIDRNFVLYKGKMLQEGKHPNNNTSIDREAAIRLDKRLVNASNPNGEQMFQYLKNKGLNPNWKRQTEAEWLPTYGDVRVTDILSKGQHKIYNHKITSDIDLNQDVDDYWKGGVFYGMVGYAWQPCSIQISSSTKGSMIGSEYWTGATGSVTYYVNKYATDYGMITHHINTVDSPGEWYIDNEKKLMYIIPPEDADPENMVYEVKSRMLCFESNGYDYIHLYNINTRGGGINFNKTTGCMVNGGDHQYNTQFTISMVESYTGGELYHRYDVIKNDYVSEEGKTLKTFHSGESGAISLSGGKNNFIVNTYIAHQAGAGIYGFGSYHYMENNDVFLTGWGCCYPAGIYFISNGYKEGIQQGGHMMYYNSSEGACRAAVCPQAGPQGAPQYIAYNDFSWSNLLSRDTGLWYQYGTSGGTQLTMGKYHHNAVHDLAASRSDSVLTAMMYNDGYTGVYDVYDNMYYCTNEDYDYEGQPYFSHGGTMCFDKSWGNYEAWYVDPEIAADFPVSYYPGSWPIDFGARKDGDPMYTKNYDRRRDAYITNLANQELSGGAFVDENGFVNLPTEEVEIWINNAELPASGAEIYFYYTSNKFEYKSSNVPSVYIELFDGDKSLGTISNRFFGHNEYRHMISRGVVYLPSGYESANRMKIFTNASNIKFANIGINPIDYDTVSKEKLIPLDVQVIPGGSYERVDIFHGMEYGAPSSNNLLTEKAGNELTYWSAGETRQNGFYYKNVRIGKKCDEVLFAGSTNGTYGQTRLDIYIGSDMSGEKIAEIDCSGVWRKGQSWHYEVVRGKVFKEIEPGIYDFYIKFNNTDDSLGPNGMSTNFGAVAFF